MHIVGAPHLTSQSDASRGREVTRVIPTHGLDAADAHACQPTTAAAACGRQECDKALTYSTLQAPLFCTLLRQKPKRCSSSAAPFMDEPRAHPEWVHCSTSGAAVLVSPSYTRCRSSSRVARANLPWWGLLYMTTPYMKHFSVRTVTFCLCVPVGWCRCLSIP